jgi:arylsulfatase A-like enzyme
MTPMFGLGSLLFLSLVSCQVDRDKQVRPNFLIIVTDDQGYADLGCFEHSAPDIKTPNMDRLAKEGILFTQAYVTAPVCSPSRAGWNTGRYQQRWGHWSWGKELPQYERTLAEYLSDAGYVTAKFGKSDFGANYHSTNVREFPLNHGFDRFLGFSSHAHDYFLLSETVERRTPDPHGHSAALGPLYLDQGRQSFESGYLTQIFTDHAIEFLKENRSQPFFMTVAYNSVHHLIHEVPDEYLEKYGAEKVPNYDPDRDGNYKDYYDKYAGPEEVGEKYRKWYLANLNCLDDNIGRLLDSLDSFDLERDTLVIFFSDNGGSPLTGALNRPLSGSKYNLLEGGIRVPFMMRYPARFSQGQIYPYIVSSLDVLPTCLDAAGIDIPPDVGLDGLSLYQILSQPAAQEVSRGALFWHFKDEFAVREGHWKIVQTKERPGSVRLYNLAEDLAETHDLAEEYPEVFARVMGLYEDWKKKMGTSGR